MDTAAQGQAKAAGICRGRVARFDENYWESPERSLAKLSIATAKAVKSPCEAQLPLHLR
ncbi:hypothetical protein NDI47_18170 [Microcoleus vaginatus GB1-A2]